MKSFLKKHAEKASNFAVESSSKAVKFADKTIDKLENNEALKTAYHNVSKATKDAVPVVQSGLAATVDKISEVTGTQDDGKFFNERVLKHSRRTNVSMKKID